MPSVPKLTELVLDHCQKAWKEQERLLINANFLLKTTKGEDFAGGWSEYNQFVTGLKSQQKNLKQNVKIAIDNIKFVKNLLKTGTT